MLVSSCIFPPSTFSHKYSSLKSPSPSSSFCASAHSALMVASRPLSRALVVHPVICQLCSFKKECSKHLHSRAYQTYLYGISCTINPCISASRSIGIGFSSSSNVVEVETPPQPRDSDEQASLRDVESRTHSASCTESEVSAFIRTRVDPISLGGRGSASVAGT